MLNLTATKPQFKVVFDQVGTPTYAWDLATAIVTIINDYKTESLNSQPSIIRKPVYTTTVTKASVDSSISLK